MCTELVTAIATSIAAIATSVATIAGIIRIKIGISKTKEMKEKNKHDILQKLLRYHTWIINVEKFLDTMLDDQDDEVKAILEE